MEVGLEIIINKRDRFAEYIEMAFQPNDGENPED